MQVAGCERNTGDPRPVLGAKCWAFPVRLPRGGRFSEPGRGCLRNLSLRGFGEVPGYCGFLALMTNGGDCIVFTGKNQHPPDSHAYQAISGYRAPDGLRQQGNGGAK